MGKKEAAEVVFWLALQLAHYLAIARAYRSHLMNGYLGKAVPGKYGLWGGSGR